MQQASATVNIVTDFGWYMVMDPAGADRELPPVEGFLPPPAGGVNGLVGKPFPWKATIATGTRRRDVQVTVEVLSAPRDALLDYEEVVETDYTVLSGTVGVLEEFGLQKHQLQVPPGDYRLRVHARGRREGASQDWDSTKPVEQHLLQIWPGQPEGEVVIRP